MLVWLWLVALPTQATVSNLWSTVAHEDPPLPSLPHSNHQEGGKWAQHGSRLLTSTLKPLVRMEGKEPATVFTVCEELARGPEHCPLGCPCYDCLSVTAQLSLHNISKGGHRVAYGA